jgi:hypothetical protein
VKTAQKIVHSCTDSWAVLLPIYIAWMKKGGKSAGWKVFLIFRGHKKYLFVTQTHRFCKIRTKFAIEQLELKNVLLHEANIWILHIGTKLIKQDKKARHKGMWRMAQGNIQVQNRVVRMLYILLESLGIILSENLWRPWGPKEA